MTSRELFSIASKIDEMRSIERKVRKLNEFELACNQELTPGQDNRRMMLEERYSEIAATFGLFAERRRDPRGPALKLHDSREKIESGTGVVL